MAKKCLYCNREIGADSSIDVCRECGIGVWGEKMFSAIVSNMDSSLENSNF